MRRIAALIKGSGEGVPGAPVTRRILTAALLYGMLLLPSLSHGRETLTLCTNNYEPYYGESMTDYGPLIRITRQAFAAVGYDTSVRFSPWARVLREAEAGECDVVVGVWFDTGRREWMVLSNPILENEVGFYKRRDDPLVFSGYTDLKSRKVVVGTVHGYISPPGLDRVGLETEEVPEDLMNMKKLISRRIGLALIDRQVGRHLLEVSGLDREATWLVTLQKLPLHNAIIKTARGNWRTRLADFNRGLALLARRGVVSRILRESHLSP